VSVIPGLEVCSNPSNCSGKILKVLENRNLQKKKGAIPHKYSLVLFSAILEMASILYTDNYASESPRHFTYIATKNQRRDNLVSFLNLQFFFM